MRLRWRCDGQWWRHDRARWRHSALIFLGAALACVPWALLNYAVFHEFFFIRSNFDLELRIGNHEGAADMEVMDQSAPSLHPRTHTAEAEKVSASGEMEYMKQARHQALQWIRENKAAFLRLTAAALLGALRILPALLVPQRAVLLIPLATFPIIFYFVGYMPRYRVPLDWILLLFAGAEAWHWIRRI